MKVFHETQSFRQWWLFLLLGSVILGLLLALYDNSGTLISFTGNEEIIIGLIITIIISGLIFGAKLHTRIDASGIKAQWQPFGFFPKKFEWGEIEKCYVREYSAITEYGGWGIRGLRRAYAYNTSGNQGIQIKTRKNQLFLIGTQKPEKATRVIEYYQRKFNK